MSDKVKLKKHYDVIVVGTGAAGCFFALSCPQELSVLMITKDKMENSDSYLAQGGICVLQTPDDFECYYEDTMRAGHYENRPESVRVMIQDSPEIMKEIIDYGVSFDKNENGEYDYTREGAHTINRILHHTDETGKEITQTLIDRVRERKNITVLEYENMIDWLVRDNVCYGVVTETMDDVSARRAFTAGSVVLATGGIGGLFKHTTNFHHVSGDSFALALKYNVELENIHYIQIHPTTLYSNKVGRRFLISESVRGEGAILLNEAGKRFVDELLPRDVVADAIRREMIKSGTDHVYITMPNMTSEECEKRFPNIYKACLDEGYDLCKDRVPVTPAQHYLMGGIRASICGETSMANLYAIGETACNGVHGANRLASNSLLESLVFAKHTAELIAEKKKEKLDAKRYTGTKLANAVDLSTYPPRDVRRKEKKKIIMDEIRRKDEEFYVKWCNNEG